MFFPHILLAFFWILYGAVHSVLANLRVKKFVQQNLPALFARYRFFYNLLAFAALAAVLFYQVTLPTVRLFSPVLFTKIAGGLLAISGLALMLVCIKKYFLSLSGLRSLWQPEDNAELQLGGVHKYVRHPLYLGTFAFLWGLFVLLPTASLLVCCSIITGYTLLGIRWEEQKLLQQFGDAYARYRNRVPMIIPKR